MAGTWGWGRRTHPGPKCFVYIYSTKMFLSDFLIAKRCVAALFSRLCVCFLLLDQLVSKLNNGTTFEHMQEILLETLSAV